MLKRVVVALLTVMAVAGLAQVASAQYMYLDTNANGVHDTGDRLNANGDSTVADLYLNTTQNRNGSAVTCNTAPGTAMDINSYAFCLVASGGTATYRNYINRQATAFPNHAEMLNPGDGTYKDAFYSFSYTPGGLLRLGTLTITGTGGSPTIGFVDIVGASQDFTSFGTPCPGIAGDNTYRLDGPNTQAFYGGPGDWFDADGLAAAAVANSPPTITNPGNKTTNELANLAFTVTATDPDAGQTVAYSLTLGAPAATGATINSSTGAFSWTPTDAQGPGGYPVTVTATDNAATPAHSDAGFTITVNEVNQAPVVTSPGNKTTNELANLSFTVTASDADIPANTITWSLTLGTPAATGATIGAGNGAFCWTPTEAQGPGMYPVTIVATDSGSPAMNGTAPITITVNEVNQAPVVTDLGNKTANEGANLAFTVTATDGDVPANTITWSLTLGTPAATGATIGASTGAFSWTPTEAQGPGTYPVTIIAMDNGSPSMSGTAAITISVTEVNQAPVLAQIGNKTGTVGTPVTFTATEQAGDG